MLTRLACAPLAVWTCCRCPNNSLSAVSGKAARFELTLKGRHKSQDAAVIKVTVYEQDSFLILTEFRLKSRYSSPSPNSAQQTKPSAASGRVTEQKSQDSIRQSVMHCVLCTHVHPPPPPHTHTYTHSLTRTLAHLHARSLVRTHARTQTYTHQKRKRKKEEQILQAQARVDVQGPCVLQGTSQVNMS